jgi:hypothetical protein
MTTILPDASLAPNCNIVDDKESLHSLRTENTCGISLAYSIPVAGFNSFPLDG